MSLVLLQHHLMYSKCSSHCCCWTSVLLPVQVLDWMKNPVPASQYNPTCPSQAEIEAKVGNKLCVMPNAGCGYVSGVGWVVGRNSG